MPPRFAYWTILIDNSPTAFRARDAQELLPTLAQLKRKNENVVLKWFSGGQLWDSPEAAREARRRPKVVEKRGADWRPGGEHRDPRARFDKNKRPKHGPKPARAFKPSGEKRPFTPGARKPWSSAKPGVNRTRFAKTWQKQSRPPGDTARRAPDARPAAPRRRWRGGRRDDDE